MENARAKRPSSVYLLNLGCSKNQVDAEHLLAEFASAGVKRTEEPEKADLLVVNTCGFIDSAKEESIQEILRLSEGRTSAQKVIAVGCLSQRYGESLRKELPEVDLMLGTYEPGELLSRLGLKPGAKGCSGRVVLDGLPHHAYLKVAEGCQRRCAYCAIPLIRGPQKSLSPREILAEARRLEKCGVREVSLVAQDLTYYGREKGGPESNLEELLRLLLAETGIEWFRLCYAYPAFVTPSLLELMASEKRICKYLDMPIQHGSDRMLEKMARGHTRRGLLTMLRRIRRTVPDIALRTTLLLGFPGETEDDVRELVDLMEEVRFDRLGCFTYSEEDGTPAAESRDPRVDPDVATEHAERVMRLQEEISLERNEALVGRELRVLVDSVDETGTAHFLARTEWDAPEVDNQVRIAEGSAKPGEFRMAKIVGAEAYDLDAVLLPKGSRRG